MHRVFMILKDQGCKTVSTTCSILMKAHTKECWTRMAYDSKEDELFEVSNHSIFLCRANTTLSLFSVSSLNLLSHLIFGFGK